MLKVLEESIMWLHTCLLTLLFVECNDINLVKLNMVDLLLLLLLLHLLLLLVLTLSFHFLLHWLLIYFYHFLLCLST